MHPSPVLFPPWFSGRCGPWKLLGVRPGRWEGAGIGEVKEQIQLKKSETREAERAAPLSFLFSYSPTCPGCRLLRTLHLTASEPQVAWSPAGAAPLPCNPTRTGLSFLRPFHPCQLLSPFLPRPVLESSLICQSISTWCVRWPLTLSATSSGLSSDVVGTARFPRSACS